MEQIINYNYNSVNPVSIIPNFEGNEITILFPEDVNFKFKGDFLIRAKNVSDILGYSKTQDLTNLVKEKYLILVKNSGLLKMGNLKLNNAGEYFLTNFGLNQVLANSTMPKAELFQDWLYEDALPTIEKHGMYAKDELLDNPDLLIEVATRLKEEKAARLLAEQKIIEMKPEADLGKAITISNDSILIGDLAKLLKQKGVDVGSKRLFELMRKNGYLGTYGNNYNIPTQKSMELGLLELKENVIETQYGTKKLSFTPMVTGKGQQYFINRILKINQLN